MSRELVLIDFSGVIFPIFATSGAEPDPNYVADATVTRIKNLAAGAEHVMICCDSGRTFRHDKVDDYNQQFAPDAPERLPGYKAARETKSDVFRHQADQAIQRLAEDGFVIIAVPGFEADDLIATATCKVLEQHPEDTVRIVAVDKDLLQLVGERVTFVKSTDGTLMTDESVREKFGVLPVQMGDFLMLCGDQSDGVRGADGIGPKKASAFLARFGSIKAFYDELDAKGPDALGLTPSNLKTMQEFRTRWPITAELIGLRFDAPISIPFDAVDEPGAPVQAPVQAAVLPFEVKKPADPPIAPPTTATAADGPSVTWPGPPAVVTEADVQRTPPAPNHAAVALAPIPPAEVLPVDQQLEPRSLPELQRLSTVIANSRLFDAWGTPEKVAVAILAGREFGFKAMASLRAFHVIEGKPTMAADAMRALVMSKKHICEYFRCVERTATKATFVTKRVGEPEMTLSCSIEEAQRAGLVKAGSGWIKWPEDMLVARATSKLARLVYSDIFHGVFVPEEFQ